LHFNTHRRKLSISMLLNDPRSLLINFWQLFLIERPDGRIYRHSFPKAENVTLVSKIGRSVYFTRNEAGLLFGIRFASFSFRYFCILSFAQVHLSIAPDNSHPAASLMFLGTGENESLMRCAFLQTSSSTRRRSTNTSATIWISPSPNWLVKLAWYTGYRTHPLSNFVVAHQHHACDPVGLHTTRAMHTLLLS